MKDWQMEKEKPYRSSPKTAKNPDLDKSLETLRKKAIEFGASDAKVIPASCVVVDERVWMKCLVPRCRGLEHGGTPHCPPNTPQPEFMRKLLSRYQWAVVFKKTFENVQDYVPMSEAGEAEIKGRFKDTGGLHRKTYEVVGRLESYAQSEGYYLAMGFSGGSCRLALCHGAICGVVENGNCRFPLKARPSMEGVGIDVFDLATKVGWDIYMIRKVEPDLSVIPCASSIGILFVC
jgi:predicted metal-binding protein